LPRIEETSLPGVGLRHEFTMEDGSRVGVVHHKSGRRELFVCPPEDPDAVSLSLNLSDEESHALADSLGGSKVIENVRDLEQHVEGLSIDWLKVEGGTPYVQKTIGDARIRSRTGVSVVAVIRDERAHPAPGPEFRIEAEDTLVVVGTSDGVKAVAEILATG